MVEQEKINQYVNDLKKTGYRPTLICVLISDNLIGLLKGRNYNGYEFVQGGIEYGESPLETLEREVMEELGYWFHKACNFSRIKMTYLFEGRMDMKIKDKLITQEGELVRPKGKHYIVFAAEICTDGELPEVNQDDVNYKGSSVKLEKCIWVNIGEAKRILKKTRNPVKRNIVLKAIDIAQEKELVR